MSENWTCLQCNAFNPQRKATCWQCGASRGESQPASPTEATVASHFHASLIFTLVRIVLLVITVAVFGLYQRYTPTTCETLSTGELIQVELGKWLPPFLFTLILLLRYVEKLLMQRSQVPTSDSKLHRAVDMAGVFIASIIGLVRYQLPWLYLLVPISYAMFHIGIWWRKLTQKAVPTLSPSVAHHMVMESQVILSAIALWPLRLQLDQPAIFFMLVFVGYQIRDWLQITGVLNPCSPTYQKMAHWARLFVDWGPIGFRLLGVYTLLAPALMMAMLIGRSPVWENPTPELMAKIIPVVIAIVLIFILVFLMITLGIAGRVAALILLLASTLLPVPSSFGLCALLLLYLGTGRLSLWTEDKLLTHWLAQDLMTQYANTKDVRSLQNIITRQNTLPLEAPVAWQTPFNLSTALKTVVKLGTLILIAYYVLFIVFALIMVITVITKGPETLSNQLNEWMFVFSWGLTLLMSIMSLGLLIFYFFHILKNTAASTEARIIFSIGIFTIPSVAMPIYYWTYIHRNPPPLWARKIIPVEPQPETA